MITINNIGRIGNQLFQIAAGLSLAKDNNDVFQLDWHCNCNTAALSKCSHLPDRNVSKYFKNKFDSNPSKVSIVHNEEHLTYYKLPYIKDMSLHGYFQSDKYFKHNEDLIRYYFDFSDSLKERMQRKYRDIFKYDMCSIHIRRGDYTGCSYFAMCDFNYFYRATNLAKSKKKIDNFVVFSDDIRWCKANFSPNFIYVDENVDVEDLYLMSMCKHNILSNSSFSWWGSYLNPNKNKLVIAPDKWNSEDNNRDIIRDDMMLIATGK